MDCLQNIIGIIETPTAELPNITTSDSGLWLEDTSTGRVPVKAAFYNDSARITSIIPDAIKEALKGLMISSDNVMSRIYTQNHSTIGFINDWTGYLTSNEGFYYQWINPKNIKGGLITIKEITIYTDMGTHIGQIDVYKGTSVLYTGLQSSFVPITTDLNEPIFIAYKGDAPRDFAHTACCGRFPTHSGYVSIGGGTVDALVNLPTNDQDFPISNYCYGIEVKCTFDCDPWSFLCGLDYTRTSFGVVFSKLVQQIARKNIIYWLLTNNKQNSYSICKEEDLRGILVFLTQDIEEMLEYLPENYDHSDCYRCEGIYKSEIYI